MQPMLLNAENLKSLAQKTHDQLSLQQGIPTCAQLLQIMSSAAYGIPYEQLAIIPVHEPLSLSLSSPARYRPVVLLYYLDHVMLVVLGIVIGSSHEKYGVRQYSLVELSQGAKDYAKVHHSSVVAIALPEVLGKNPDDDKIIELALLMGYFRAFGSIFNKLSNSTISVNGALCLNKPYLNWEDRICEAVENGSDYKTFLIWQPGAGALREVTFSQLCNANTYDGVEWDIPTPNGLINVEFQPTSTRL
jgi:hypothetical protein